MAGTCTLGLPPSAATNSSGVLSQEIERAVMTGNDGFEGEIAVHGLGRDLAAHGETVADRDEADFRAINLANQRHVRKDRRIAHMVNGGPARRRDDDAHRIAEIDRLAVDDRAGRMKCRGEAHLEILERDRAAGIAGIDARRALARRDRRRFRNSRRSARRSLWRSQGCRRHDRHGRASAEYGSRRP